MKRPVLKIVEADSAVAAAELVFPGRVVHLEPCTVESIRRSVQAKLQRAQQNSTLYADQIAAYNETLRALGASDGAPEVMKVAQAVLALGDSSIEHPGHCLVLRAQDRWVVVGYTFQ